MWSGFFSAVRVLSTRCSSPQLHCKQNIVEGSAAAITSKETEIKLTNVARASLCELQEDYEDYLAFRGLKPWPKDHPRIRRLRAYVRSVVFDGEYVELCRRLPAEEFCNLALTLIIKTEYLLDKMLVAQQRRFLESGGIREAMSAARRDYRQRQENQNNQSNQNNQNNSNDSNSSNSSNNPNPPLCPKCGKPMLRRKQKKLRRRAVNSGAAAITLIATAYCRLTKELEGDIKQALKRK